MPEGYGAEASSLPFASFLSSRARASAGAAAGTALPSRSGGAAAEAGFFLQSAASSQKFDGASKIVQCNDLHYVVQ